MTHVRPATEADLATIKAIYDVEVRTGIVTFATEPPGVDYWRERLESTDLGDHALVAVDGDDVVGYAYSGSYRPRQAYARTREASVYLASTARGGGLGRALYDELLRQLRADGVRLVVAVIALPNDGSQGLHRACGFERVGVLHDVGYKFGRWIDTEAAGSCGSLREQQLVEPAAYDQKTDHAHRDQVDDRDRRPPRQRAGGERGTARRRGRAAWARPPSAPPSGRPRRGRTSPRGTSHRRQVTNSKPCHQRM